MLAAIFVVAELNNVKVFALCFGKVIVMRVVHQVQCI